MKLSLISNFNASYDMIGGQPKSLGKIGLCHVVRINIEPVFSIDEESKDEIQIGWKCFEIKVCQGELDAYSISNAIVKEVLDGKLDSILSNYEMYRLGVDKNPTYLAEYKRYLTILKEVNDKVSNLEIE